MRHIERFQQAFSSRLQSISPIFSILYWMGTGARGGEGRGKKKRRDEKDCIVAWRAYATTATGKIIDDAAAGCVGLCLSVSLSVCVCVSVCVRKRVSAAATVLGQAWLFRHIGIRPICLLLDSARMQMRLDCQPHWWTRRLFTYRRLIPVFRTKL